MFTAVAVVARSAEIVTERGDSADIALFHWDYQALFAIPIVVFGFNCHANVVTIFSCAPLAPSHRDARVERCRPCALFGNKSLRLGWASEGVVALLW